MVTELISAIVIGAVVGAIGWFLVRGKYAIAVWLPIVAGAALALVGTVVLNVAGLAQTAGLGWKDAVLHVVLAAIGVGAAVAMSRGGKTASST